MMRGGLRLLGPPSSVSAVARAERIMVLLASAVRLSTLLDMMPSAKLAYDTSDRPAVTLATWVVATAAALAFVARAVTRARPLPAREAVIDAGIAVALLVAGAWTVPVDQRIGTWVGFEPGYALSVVIATSSCTSLRAWAVGLVGVVFGKLAYVWSALSWDVASTVVGDFLTVTALGVIAAAMARFLRGLALEADHARHAAVAEEVRRAGAAFHNGVAVLGLLAEADLDPVTRRAVQTQARAEVHRVRSYLRGQQAATIACGVSAVPLHDVICSAARSFPDLAPRVVLDLIGDLQVAHIHAIALERALTSLLLNVRLHAAAGSTVVHADVDERVWTVTVHDDGLGFDVAHTDLGVGLQYVVIAALAEHGIRTAISSTQGLGTTVTLMGSLPGSLPGPRGTTVGATE